MSFRVYVYLNKECCDVLFIIYLIEFIKVVCMVRNFLNKFILIVKQAVKKTMLYCFWLMPIREDVITFEAYSGQKIDGNPKAIYMGLKSKKCKYKLKWFVNKNILSSCLNQVDKKELVVKGTIKWIYYTSVSKYWIKNTGKYGGMAKRRKQIYLNTWHSANVLKKQGYDLLDVSLENRVPLSSVANWDWYIAGSDEKAIVLSRSMGYTGKIKVLGMPRTDAIVNHTQKQAEEIRNKLGISIKEKVILYAPTFRDNDLDGKNIENVLSEIVIPEGCIFLTRLHHLTKINGVDRIDMLDVSKYPDINHLFIIADLLISDYSSVIFDYSNLRKPVILYAYDFEEYLSMRGFYLDYEKVMPGPIVKNVDELNFNLANIGQIDNKYKKKRESFYDMYCKMNDGNATNRFIEILRKREFDWRRSNEKEI